MNLLKYEFMDAPEGSYNELLKQLFQDIRHYRENVSVEDFKAAIPKLHEKERVIQKLDEGIGADSRNYIEEIMAELETEDEIESQLLEEIERTSKAITSSYNIDFDLEDFSFEFRNNEGVFWIQFYGYKQEGGILGCSIVKEVFRSVCYKAGITFIDSAN